MAITKEALTITMDNGTADGTLICNLMGWDCEVYKIDRTNLNTYVNEVKLKECGIYFLIGEDNGTPAVYVGQANSRNNGKGVLGRVVEHDKPQEAYWKTALLLHSNSNALYATELNYLERHFWVKLKDSGFQVMNASKPSLGNYPQLTKIAMDKFMVGAEMIIHVLGYQFLEQKKQSTPNMPVVTSGAKQFFITRTGKGIGRDVDAVCEIRNGQFVVLKGSLIATVKRNASDTGDYSRTKYGAFIDAKGRLTQDLTFDKVSSSSAFVIYGSSNGNVDWKDASGQPIKNYLP